MSACRPARRLSPRPAPPQACRPGTRSRTPRRTGRGPRGGRPRAGTPRWTRSVANTRARSDATGSMIPLSIPASAARSMNTSLSSFRSGIPNETFDRPPVRWIEVAVLGAQPAGRLEDVHRRLGLDRHGQHERIDVEEVRARSRGPMASLDEGDRVRDAFLGVGRHPARPARREDDGTAGLRGKVEDLRALDGRGVEQQPARRAAARRRRPPRARQCRTSRSRPAPTPSPPRPRRASAIARARTSESGATSSALRSSQSAPAASWRAAIERMYAAARSACRSPSRPQRIALATCLILPAAKSRPVTRSGWTGRIRRSPSASSNAIPTVPSSSSAARRPARLTTRVAWMFSPMTRNGVPVRSGLTSRILSRWCRRQRRAARRSGLVRGTCSPRRSCAGAGCPG